MMIMFVVSTCTVKYGYILGTQAHFRYFRDIFGTVVYLGYTRYILGTVGTYRVHQVHSRFPGTF